MSNWYAIKCSRGQHLIVTDDEDNTVALAYNERDARLLAAAPAMLRALKRVNDNWDLLPNGLQRVVVEAIERAEEYETI